MSKTAPEPRQAIFDELGVSRPTADASDPSALYVSLSHMDVADLICEGGIEGLVSGEYHFEGMEGGLGYENFTFEKYSALDELGNDGWELISIENVSPSGFDGMKFGANKVYNFKREKK